MYPILGYPLPAEIGSRHGRAHPNVKSPVFTHLQWPMAPHSELEAACEQLLAGLISQLVLHSQCGRVLQLAESVSAAQDATLASCAQPGTGMSCQVQPGSAVHSASLNML